MPSFTSSQGTNEGVNYFDNLIAEQIDTPISDPYKESPNSAGMLTKEQFTKMYCTGFKVASHLSGFKSIMVTPEDAAAIEGFGALYETAYDIDMLHFMLKPSGKWLGRIIAMGALFGPMAIGLSQEFKPKEKIKNSEQPEQYQQPEKPRADGEPSADQIATLTGVSK
jgi:hypothetical protein